MPPPPPPPGPPPPPVGGRTPPADTLAPPARRPRGRSLAEQLQAQAASLDKVAEEDRRDRSAPNKHVASLGLEEQFAVNVEVWEAALAGHTIDGVGVPFASWEEVEAVLNPASPARGAVKARLAAAMARRGAAERGVFVKMAQAPKDATVADGRMRREYERLLQAALQERGAAGVAELGVDRAVRLLFAASLRALRVHTADEAFDLMEKSARSRTDVELALLARPAAKIPLELVVREWIDIPLWGELRGFMHGGELRALSQYFYLNCFDELADPARRRSVVASIERFFADVVRPALMGLKPPVQDCIVDFAVLADRVIVIELNPFADSTSACLFSWDADRELLRNGAPGGGCTVRVTEAPCADLREKIVAGNPEWEEFLPPARRGVPRAAVCLLCAAAAAAAACAAA